MMTWEGAWGEKAQGVFWEVVPLSEKEERKRCWKVVELVFRSQKTLNMMSRYQGYNCVRKGSEDDLSCALRELWRKYFR